jgi:hypothetical protein
MRISGAIPPQVNRAYGITPAKPPSSVCATESLQRASAVQKADRYTPQAASNIQKLVAGTVDQPVTFDGVNAPRPAKQSVLPLYTRAADTIEAATGIQVGRSIDISA